MLMPILSVSAIGLVIGLVGGALSRSIGRGLVRGLIAAWIGFAAGALIGVIIDSLTGTGSWLAWLGHLGALIAAGMSARPKPVRAAQAVNEDLPIEHL